MKPLDKQAKLYTTEDSLFYEGMTKAHFEANEVIAFKNGARWQRYFITDLLEKWEQDYKDLEYTIGVHWGNHSYRIEMMNTQKELKKRIDELKQVLYQSQ